MSIGNIPNQFELRGSSGGGLFDHPVSTCHFGGSVENVIVTIAPCDPAAYNRVGRMVIPDGMRVRNGEGSDYLRLSRIGYGAPGDDVNFDTPAFLGTCHLWRLDSEQTVLEFGLYVGYDHANADLDLRVRYSTKADDYIGDHYEKNVGKGLIGGTSLPTTGSTYVNRSYKQTFKKLVEDV